MPIVNLTPKRVEIHKTDEGDSEWNLSISARAAGNGSGNYYTNWYREGVSNGDKYDLQNQGNWNFFIGQGEKIRLGTWGVEVDGGFLDPDDKLPGVIVDVDPASAGPEFRVNCQAGDFNYTVVWNFSLINI